MGQTASGPYPMQANSAEIRPAPAAEDVHLMITASGSVRGEMSFRIPSAHARQLVKVFTGTTETTDTTPTADDGPALEELFRQVAGHVVTSARQKGLEVQFTTSVGETPTWSPGASGWIGFGASAPQLVQIEWKLSSALSTALVNTWQEPNAVKQAGSPRLDTKTGKVDKSTAPIDLPSKLDILLDVELDVALRFGGRNILLKEILELGPGSVLELDRDIQDDADLILDGKLIARGELVAVEGNFGLRITEVFAGQHAG
jgi:flagellar motor switch protein FliN/FliY